MWRQADNARRARWVEVGRHRRTVTVLRAVAGVLLVTAGVTGIFVLQGSAAHLGSVLQAALAVLVGITLLAGPYLVRMTQDLSEERLMRIRAQERAEVAAHVHDSVLHTLTLIQRNADNPGEVRRLARAQERDLRAWLYRPEGNGKDEDDEPATLAEAVKRNAAEVEDKHGVPLEVVVVGDCPSTSGSGRRCRPRARRWSTPPSTVARAVPFRSTPKSRAGRSSCPSGTAAPASTSTRYPPTAWESENRSSAAWSATAARRGCARCPAAARRSSWRWRGRRRRHERPDRGERHGVRGGAGGRRVRVVLVDDHRMFRTGVQAEIGQTEQTGVEVVGEAADVDQAVTVITATRPEVVLLDVHLPGGGGWRSCAAVLR